MLTYLSIVPQMISLIGKQFVAEASLQEIKLFWKLISKRQYYKFIIYIRS